MGPGASFAWPIQAWPYQVDRAKDLDLVLSFYLQDILVHEIGHHVDRANLGHPKESEAYARWFATEYGFRRESPGGKRF